MIEVLFGESEGGSMKVAKNYKSDYSYTSIGLIGDKKPTQEELDRMKEEFIQRFGGKAVGGTASDVICLPFQLDIGDIRIPVDSEYRKELIRELYTINGEEFGKDSQWVDEAWNKYLKELERLKSYVAKGESLRIWYSDAPYSICGFYYVCSLLHEYIGKLTAIKLPRYKQLSENTIQFYTSWGEIDPGLFYEFLPLGKELSTCEQLSFASKWTDLQEDQSLLRAVVNGQVLGVPEDFYDYIIRKELPEDEFVMARLIGTVIGKYSLGIGDAWLSKRIIKMIELSEIVIVQKQKEVFRQILKKT